MPYSGANDASLPSNVKKLDTAARKQWVATFNSTLKACEKDGGEGCEGKAMKTANGVVKKRFLQMLDQIQEFAFAPVIRAIATLAEHLHGGPVLRAMSMIQLREAVWAQLYERYRDGELDEGMYPTDLFYDDGDLTVLLSKDGQLYRAPISINEDDAVTVGPPEPITIKLQPVTRTTVVRSKDGRYRWVSISATSIINRDNEIDSRVLFDSFVARAQETGEYPVRMFFHQGESFYVGQADYLARDENVYITSGLYDDIKENVLAKAEVRARQRNAAYWADSIGYDPLSEPELAMVAEGINVPVYVDGVHREISTLPHDLASSMYTMTSMEVKRMNKTVKAALTRLFEDGEMVDELETFEEHVDEVNRAAESKITRAADADGANDDAAATGEGAPGDDDDAVASAEDEGAPEVGEATEPTELTQAALIEKVVVEVLKHSEVAGLQSTVTDLQAVTGQVLRTVNKMLEAQADAPEPTYRPRATVTTARTVASGKGDGDDANDAIAAVALKQLPERV